jgi:hypothetical protein
MKRSEKTAFWASVLAVIPVVVLGAALGVALRSLAQGFVLLGAISLITASIVLWRPFASRLLEEGIRSARLEGAVDAAYRRHKDLTGHTASWRRSVLFALLVVLAFLSAGPLLGLQSGQALFPWETLQDSPAPAPMSKGERKEREVSIRKHRRGSSPRRSHRRERRALTESSPRFVEAPPSSGRTGEVETAAEPDEMRSSADDPWAEEGSWEEVEETEPGK